MECRRLEKGEIAFDTERAKDLLRVKRAPSLTGWKMY